MAIVDLDGNRVTPTEVAKAAIESAAYMAVESPMLEYRIDLDKLTPREQQRIEDAIFKQYERVRRLMGFPML